MENAVSAVERACQELLGRSSGPFHLRLILQPTMATLLAIRAGLRDARAGAPPFLVTFFTDRAERKRLVQSASKDIGKLFVIAIVLDVIYQFVELHAFRWLQTVIVVVVLAILPYTIVRSLVSRLGQKRNSPTS
jgi:hypothetical protein